MFVLLLQEQSSWRLRSLESLQEFVSCCTEELIWLNEREEEEISFDWSEANSNMSAKKELHHVSLTRRRNADRETKPFFSFQRRNDGL